MFTRAPASIGIPVLVLVLLSCCLLPAEAGERVRVSGPLLIEDPQNRSTEATDINNRGMLVGNLTTVDPFTSVAFVWSKRTGIVELPRAVENGRSSASGINDCGEIVGQATLPDGTRRAVRWTRAGELEDLGALDETGTSAATDINELGAVVGFSAIDDADVVHAFLWTEAGGMRDLGSLGAGEFSVANAINNRNEVAGSSPPPPGGGDPHAFFWSRRTGMIDLVGLPGGDESAAFGINDRSVVVGSAEVNGVGDFHAFAWTRKRGVKPLAFLDAGRFSVANDISNGGLIVGASEDSGRRRATLWLRRNEIVILPAEQASESRANAINDRGSIAGAITLESNSGVTQTRAALWQIERRFFKPPHAADINRLCRRSRH